MAAALLLSACAVGCSGNKEASELASLAEVKEMNAELQMPFKLGVPEQKLKDSGFEMKSGIEHHIANYRSVAHQDISYTLGTYEMHYGEPDPNQELYVTGFRIVPLKKEIKKNDDGSTTPVYTTTRSVFGIKVGDDIATAKATLLAHGYEIILEEPKEMTGLPRSRENTFRKGAIMFSMAVERTDDISQISIWVPYYNEDIALFNADSELPADLGLIYSVLKNPDFSYAGKTQTARRYTTEDGCDAIMRGFPDYIDMRMTAYVSFVSDKYDVLGVKVGMSTADAAARLVEKGCVEENGYYYYKSVTAVKLESQNGIVTKIAACLRPSTNLSNIEISEEKPTESDPKTSTIGGSDGGQGDKVSETKAPDPGDN